MKTKDDDKPTKKLECLNCGKTTTFQLLQLMNQAAGSNEIIEAWVCMECGSTARGT